MISASSSFFNPKSWSECSRAFFVLMKCRLHQLSLKETFHRVNRWRLGNRFGEGSRKSHLAENDRARARGLIQTPRSIVLVHFVYAPIQSPQLSQPVLAYVRDGSAGISVGR